MAWKRWAVAAACVVALGSCAAKAGTEGGAGVAPASEVIPGVSVFVRDSLELVRGLRVALITNQTGLTEAGESTIDALHAALPSRNARLVALFSPEHGIRGTEDRENIESGRDERTGLPVHSLYTTQTIPPPDSLLADVDALVFDLFDIGTRTWTYVGAMVYAMRAAARRGIPFIVLDRPNPITGQAEGPMLDSSLANAADPAPGRPGRAYALWPAPLRHGLTMGEMARWFNADLAIGARLHVIPAEGWTRSMWWDETGIPWVRPSPNIPSLTSALLYPALVALEGSNVSVGRGTDAAFQRFGAPWLAAREVADSLNRFGMPGVAFVADSFTPRDPGDRKYADRTIPGVRIDVVDRHRVRAGRLASAIVWALGRVHADSLRVTAASFDLRFGSAELREALLAGTDPDRVMDGELTEVAAWERHVRRYLIYR